MKIRRAFTVFTVAFAIVLIGGLALAQVGALRPATLTISDDAVADGPSDRVDEPVAEETPDAKTDGEIEAAGGGDDVDRPKETPKTEEPRDDPREEPKDDPSDGSTGDEGTKGDEGDDGDDGEKPDTTPPGLKILHPEDGQVFHEKTIAFEGVTEPGAKVAAGRYEAEVNDDGAWRIVLVLSAGRNVASFTATDAAGNTTKASVVVVYEELKPEPADREFTANQKYGKSSATPPFDVFWGTAKAGAKIWIGSEYGSKQVTATSKGNWEAKVTFAEAPVGKAIRVVVESNDGGRKVFEFINKGSGEGQHEFTAYQTYGECGEELPYDVFHGKADAGERIWVESMYGSGVTEANDDGRWEIRVNFPEAPVGKTFEVVIEAKNGGRKVFTFTRTGSDEK